MASVCSPFMEKRLRIRIYREDRRTVGSDYPKYGENSKGSRFFRFLNEIAGKASLRKGGTQSPFEIPALERNVSERSCSRLTS